MTMMRDVLESKGHAVHTCESDATVLAAVDEMCLLNVGALLVMWTGKPIGIITERDVLRRLVLKRADAATTRVVEIMTADIVCVGASAPIEEAMAIMTEHRCRHLPVVDGGRVVGIVSIGDLVRWVSVDRQHEIELLHDYVAGRYA
jgi:CBS domain-containing protein